jgi:hypothetical protein
VELWGTKGTDKKYFLILSTQIEFGAHPVSYSMTVRGCRNYEVFVDITNIKKYTLKKKSNKTFEGRKKQREKQDKISILLYFTSFL